ncbi:MAG: pyridoxamine 5'-phosphate oxidase, partial [Bdellovibrionales bacterium]|nr:pyridoxamine 5'-phosphate oxidase [Bdellovibrionales bacterium]
MNDKSDNPAWSHVPKEIRRDYHHDGLEIEKLNADPVLEFENWFNEAVKNNLDQANAMSLATASLDAKPSVRKVLLKQFSQEGFVFYTNYNSRKAKEILANPFAALLFYWAGLDRQIRIEGKVEKVSKQTSDEYFNSRPWGAQLGAYISPQSQEIEDRETLDELYKNAKKDFDKQKIPRPVNWGGFLLIPTYFEFWQGR